MTGATLSQDLQVHVQCMRLSSIRLEIKEGGKKIVTQRGAALFCTLGYNFQMRDKVALFIEFEYEHFITEGLINVIV